MKSNFNSISTIVSGAKVLMLVGELARVHHKKLSLNSLWLVSTDFEGLTINQLRKGILYCLDKGLVSQGDDGRVYPSLEVSSLVKGKLLEAMGWALENICTVHYGVLEYEDFIKANCEDLSYAAFMYDLPEESVSVIRELLLEWHLVRLDGTNSIIVE